MSKSKRLKDLAALAADVERLCHRVGADRWLRELQLVAESQERQHRAMGKRVCGATYAGSVRDAVNYFICKTVLEDIGPPIDWRAVCSLRRDYVLGAACREAILASTDLTTAELELCWTELAIDYSEHIAGNR